MSATCAPEEFAAPLPWRRAVAWLLLLGPFFFLSYGWANHLAAARGVQTAVYFAWERQIPFWPWTIVPYWSIDALYGFAFLCCRTPREVDRYALRLLTAQCLAVACFALFPLRFAFERPAADGVFGAMFDALTSFDQPYNQAPSLHIALLVLIWSQFARMPWPAWARWCVHGWAVLIGISVLTTWQHHFFDVPTGAALGLFCLWVWPEASMAPVWRRSREGDAPARRRLAWSYALGAAAVCALAGVLHGLVDELLGGFLGGLVWILAWPAAALAIVAWNYAWCGASGFQKRDGEPSLAVRWLLAPHRLGAWLNSRWWTRAQPQDSFIVDGVWLGRMPSAHDVRTGGYASLIDLSAELRAPRGPWRIDTLPRLDLVPADAAQLVAAAQAIESAQRRGGKVLVVCALGYSRSASAVAAWLVLTGRAADVPAALALVRAARGQIVLGPPWVGALEAAAMQGRGAAHG